MLIEVTRAEIEAGERGWAGRCPVALAVNQAVGPKIAVRVLCGRVEFYSFLSGNWTTPLPANVRETVQNYDLTGAMEPFVFDLDLSCPLPPVGGDPCV